MNHLTVLQKKSKKQKNKWICIFDFRILTKTLWLQDAYLGKSSANDICSHFEQCLGPLKKEKLLQVSSDGPDVNLLFSKSIQKSVRMKNLAN